MKNNNEITLEKIEKIVDKVVSKKIIEERKYTEKMMDKKLDKHRDGIIAYIKVRHDELRDQIRDIETELAMISGKLTALETKIDSIKKMETEDIEKAYNDIAEIKERLSFVENKLAIIKH